MILDAYTHYLEYTRVTTSIIAIVNTIVLFYSTQSSNMDTQNLRRTRNKSKDGEIACLV